MRHTIVIAACGLIAAILATGCERRPVELAEAEALPIHRPADASPDDGAILTDVPGRIVKVSDDRWGIVPDSDSGTRYAPDALADDFKVDGLEVVFSGEVGKIAPNERRWGTPLHLTAIRRAG